MASEARTERVGRYGWRPSLPDPRDIPADPTEIPIRDEVDPRSEYMTPVYDQLHLNSCNANAVAAAVDAARIVDGKNPLYPARLAIYWLERFVEHQSPVADDGAYGRDGFKVARRYGVIPENDWPYTDDKSDPHFSQDPRQDSAWEGHHWILQDKYKAVRRSLTDFKRVLSNRQTIAFGFTVPASFDSPEMWQTGIMADPDPSDLTEDGHEVLAVGYLKDQPPYCLVRNSWGTEFGISGYFLMPWAWLLDAGLSRDFRTIYRPLPPPRQ
jgi:C1A family cysteine protease